MAVTLWLLREACARPSACSQMKTAGKVNAVAERETECGVRARKAAAAAGSQSYYDAQKSSLTVWFLLPVRARRPPYSPHSQCADNEVQG